MRNSFVSWLTAVAIALGLALGGPSAASAESIMRTCATEWKQAQVSGATDGQSWPQFLAQCRTRQGARRPILDGRSRAWRSFRFTVPMVAAFGAGFGVRVKCRRGLGRPKRHEGMRKPMERRQGGWNHRRPILAAVSRSVPHPSGLGRRLALRRFRSRAGACARLPVRLLVPLVASVRFDFGASDEHRRARGAGGWPIHDRTGGPRPMPVWHDRMGQYAEPYLPLLGNPLLWPDAPRRLYV